jgi:hypothetical protein
VEAHYPCLKPIIFAIVTAEALGHQFFPTICILRLGRISVLFFEGRAMYIGLTVLRINAGGRGVKVSANAVPARGL